MDPVDFVESIEYGLRGRHYVQVVETTEEGRALSLIKKAAERVKLRVISWDIADGFKWLDNSADNLKDQKGQALSLNPSNPNAISAESCLSTIDNCGDRIIFVLKDFHEFWENAKIKRKLRNLSQLLKPADKSIIIINPSRKIPDELRDDVSIIDLPLPREQELDEILRTFEEKQKTNVTINLNEAQRKRFLQAGLGLTSVQAQRAYRRAAVRTGKIDESHIKLITEEKRAMIRQSEALEFFPVSETFEDIGGLEYLKEWLLLRKEAFSESAKKFGLPSPKGIALIGIPGTGKSLTAKAIGSIWRLPVLRLDVGALFGGLVGESEERTRKALAVANTISPCILWIDEIEKAFGQGDLDGGTSARVFASILTWMQEKTAPVFVVATANNISSLRPELLRKGRFDEIFFLDLPSESERREIFSVLLKKNNRPAKEFDLELLARESHSFVGAEIEQAINDALYEAFCDKHQLLKTDHIIKSLKKLIPLSVSQKEEIGRLREWLNDGRAVSASFKGKKEAQDNAVEVDELISVIGRN